MKLARPDIRHPRIVLVGSEGGDDAGLVAALRKRGLHARWLPWDDPDTLDADLVILRTAADYADRLDEFLAWTKRVSNLLNGPTSSPGMPASAICAICDTRGCRFGLAEEPPQPSERRWSYLGGTQSHAFDTAAASPVEADFELWDLGQTALQAAADQLGIGVDELLYARADVIGGPGDAELVELNLVAPSLGWQLLDDTARGDAQRQFALCVESALDRLGLGPLSHRRP